MNCDSVLIVVSHLQNYSTGKNIQMKPTKLLFTFVVWISICACDKKINLGEFDKNGWKSDFNGCKGIRELQLKHIDLIKKEFTGMRETQLHEILGKPNKQELKERNCKTYYYYVSPGAQCTGSENPKGVSSLIVELDALNRVSLMRFTFDIR